MMYLEKQWEMFMLCDPNDREDKQSPEDDRPVIPYSDH